ncbi:ABC transporter substrate-binding protein [Ornithinibacillus sp. 4-3]|uniref:ABC transporter substrate-binding protein n=1 Tax=Ornithinibacillus sp. 4-3 TaxID=3231488 RepID=A0AB39HNS1_9BACI
MKKLFKNGLFLMLLAALMLVIAACSSDSGGNDDSDSGDNTSSDETDNNDGDDEEAQGEAGGTLRIAIDAAPPTLDQPTSTATAARDASRLIFETLVTTKENFEPEMMLAESIETEDNQTFTINLREGVKFHNGEEMTSEDVIASMERWLEKSSVTGNIFNDATWTADGDYTVILELQSPSSLTLDTMASAKQAAAIMPKEVIDNASDGVITEFIGTGPFKFEEWKQDQYIHYVKYDEYQPVDLPADGLSGKKEALVDEIYIYIVNDSSTRLAGLQTGEYDFAYGIPYDNYDALLADDNLETILTPSANQMMGLNKVQGIATDPKFRQAVNAALDAEQVMFAAFPDEDFFWLDSGYMDMYIEPWLTDAGNEYYNQANPERAKELLDEIGYNNEEFRIMTTRDYDHHYNSGVVIQEQLKQAGINAVLEVYDWPSLLDKRENDLGAWDAFMTSSSTVSTPPQLIGMSTTWAGGMDDSYVEETMAAIEGAPTIEEAKELWDELQLYAWEELVPIVHFGGYHSLYGHTKNVKGITNNTGPIFWNVTVSE